MAKKRKMGMKRANPKRINAMSADEASSWPNTKTAGAYSKSSKTPRGIKAKKAQKEAAKKYGVSVRKLRSLAAVGQANTQNQNAKRRAAKKQVGSTPAQKRALKKLP